MKWWSHRFNLTFTSNACHIISQIQNNVDLVEYGRWYMKHCIFIVCIKVKINVKAFHTYGRISITEIYFPCQWMRLIFIVVDTRYSMKRDQPIWIKFNSTLKGLRHGIYSLTMSLRCQFILRLTKNDFGEPKIPSYFRLFDCQPLAVLLPQKEIGPIKIIFKFLVIFNLFY